MSVARHELDEAIGGKRGETHDASTTAPRRRPNPLVLAASVAAALAIGVFGTSLYNARQAPPSSDGTRLVAQMVAPDDAATAFSRGFALSPDGTIVAFSARNKAGLNRVLLRRLDADTAHDVPGTEGGSYPFWADFTTKTQRPWLANGFSNRFARFSPDGRWVACASDVSGRMEIYLRAFEGEGQSVAVSAGGGVHPFWRSDGEELFYLGPADEVMSVSVTRLGSTIVPGKPKQRFRIPLNDVTRERLTPYGVSPDGQRFLLNVVDHPAPLFLLQGLAGMVK